MAYNVAHFESIFELLQKEEFFKGPLFNFEQFESNQRFKYLEDYLMKIGAKTVIVESPYVDSNFIEDFCGHYARCFSNYPKYCKRIHFFRNEFNEEELFSRVVDEKNSEFITQLIDEYLGFIVIRPVPNAILGKVCVAVYPPEEGKNRIFPLLRTYTANILGVELSVESLAYQEQDNVISACATSSVWSAFHALDKWFRGSVPSPFQISANAKSLNDEQYTSDSVEKGLSADQMAKAISREGLNPLIYPFISISYTKAMARAYLNMHLPIILAIRLRYQDELAIDEKGNLREAMIGNHAVTIAGYRLGNDPLVKVGSDRIKENDPENSPRFMRSSAIVKFYVHDDQVGPFSSMISRNEYWQHLETRWNYYGSNPKDYINASIDAILIPCFKKVRIKFPSIWSVTQTVNSMIGEFWWLNDLKLIWDIRLYTTNQFKSEVRREKEELINREVKNRILNEALPKYLWKVDCHVANEDQTKEEPAFMYIFDATDMESSNYLSMALHYNENTFKVCQSQILDYKEQSPLQEYKNRRKVSIIRALMDSYLEPKFEKMGESVIYINNDDKSRW